jgi:3-phenylpropionate/trans-cinnamate dioxygenase ferredoxin reductase component
MTKRRTFGIVGGGLAGAGAAATLRAEGFDGRVVLVSEELWMPYERPPLTKDFLAGASVASAAYVHPPSFYAEHDIELMAGAQATGYDASTGDLELDHAAVLRCEALLLASGSASRRIPLSGGDLHAAPPCADAHDVRAWCQPLASPRSVVERANRQHVVRVAAG